MSNNVDFTIADVLAWARTKPADERYSYTNITGCALCQFLRDRAVDFRTVGGRTWVNGDGQFVNMPDGLPEALFGDESIIYNGSSQWTFGRLVKRLEALCPETPVTRENWSAIDAYLSDIEQVLA